MAFTEIRKKDPEQPDGLKDKVKRAGQNRPAI